MNRIAFLGAVTEALQAITVPRFYENERGFQGQFNVELQRRLPRGLLPIGAVLEEEHQKLRDLHGITVRPDLILHEPFDPSRHNSRADGNYVAMAFKRNASRKAALADLEDLGLMLDRLNYELAAFINIGSDRTYSHSIPRQYQDRLVCFAVTLSPEGVARVER